MSERYAYFTLQERDIDESLEARLSAFSVIVYNTSIPPERMIDVRRRLPFSILLGYINAGEINFPPDREPEWEYAKEVKETFPARALWKKLNGYGVSFYTGPDGRATTSHYSLTPEAIRWQVERSVERIRSGGASGVYVDDLSSYLPPFRIRQIEAWGGIDANGDGVADTAHEIAAFYTDANPVLSWAIRKAWPEAIIIGNSGVGRIDHALNGISLESAFAAAKYRASFDFAHSPTFGIAWCENPIELASARAVLGISSDLKERVLIGQYGNGMEIVPGSNRA